MYDKNYFILIYSMTKWLIFADHKLNFLVYATYLNVVMINIITLLNSVIDVLMSVCT